MLWPCPQIRLISPSVPTVLLHARAIYPPKELTPSPLCFTHTTQVFLHFSKFAIPKLTSKVLLFRATNAASPISKRYRTPSSSERWLLRFQLSEQSAASRNAKNHAGGSFNCGMCIRHGVEGWKKCAGWEISTGRDVHRLSTLLAKNWERKPVRELSRSGTSAKFHGGGKGLSG